MTEPESDIRHKLSATITWEADFSPNCVNVSKEAREYLRTLLPDAIFDIKTLRVLHPQTKKKIVIAEYPAVEVLSKITSSSVRMEFVVDNQTFYVKMNSSRYFLFKENPKCVSCGLEGTKFLLEQHQNDRSPHFNLYGDDNGVLVLLTKDHVVPRSKGGESKKENYTTTCAICNNLKADFNLTYEQVFELKKLWDDSKAFSRKERSRLIRVARENMVKDNDELGKKCDV